MEELLATDVASLPSGARSEWVLAMDGVLSRARAAFLAGLAAWDAAGEWALDGALAGGRGWRTGPTWRGGRPAGIWVTPGC